MAEKMKKNENIEEKNEETKVKEPENEVTDGGVENPPAETDDGKKDNVFKRGWNSVKKFGNEKVKPAAKKAAPWVGGALIGATVLGGVLLKKGLNDARNEAEDDDDDDLEDIDAIDVEATVEDADNNIEE